MRFFGLKNCDTCRKALRELENSGAEVAVTDVRADGVSGADLESFLDAFGDDLVNLRSTTWRNLSEAERTEPPLKLVTDHPTLMKRPVIEMDDGTLHLGWSDAVRAAVLKH